MSGIPAGPDPQPRPTRPARPARPRGAWAAATLIPIVVVLALGGILLLAVRSPSPRSSVSKALTATLAEHSAAAALSGSEHLDGVVVPIDGSGLFDFIHNDGSMVLNLTSAGQSIREKTVTYDQSIYLNLGQIVSQVLPGKSWVSINAAQYSANGAASSGLGAGGPSTGSPGAIFNILGNGANAVTALGPSTIHGVPVQGYLVVVNPATIKAEISNSHLPAWERQAARSISDTKAGYKVFVGPSGLVHRLTIGMTENASGGHIEIFISMDFANFGTPVKVTPPPAGQVGSYAAFIKAAEALQSTTVN